MRCGSPSTLRLVRQHWRSQPAPSNALSSLWHEYGALLSARCCCAFWTYIPDAETYLRAALGLLGSLLRHRQGVPVVVLVGFNRSDQAFTRIIDTADTVDAAPCSPALAEPASAIERLEFFMA
jgi:hypothetical protein